MIIQISKVSPEAGVLDCPYISQSFMMIFWLDFKEPQVCWESGSMHKNP